MITSKFISDLIEGRKLDTPVQPETDQLLLLEIARYLRSIRGSVGFLSFLAGAAVAISILSFLFN
ncbi:MAG TPA: hypothetical protein VIH16_03850 [Bellilinea sp.]